MAEVTVYADILLLVNYSMDYVILWFVGLMQHLRIRHGRLLIAALPGGVFGLFSVLYAGSGFITWLLALFLCPVMCMIAYGADRFRFVLRSSIWMLLLSILFSGLLSFAADLALKLPLKPALPAGKSPPSLFFIYVFGAFFLLVLFWRLMRTKRIADTAEAEITICGVRQKLHCMVDTGNRLTEPISGLPVIVCRRELLAPYIPLWKNRFCVVPTVTATGNAVLYGFRTDGVIVRTKGRAIERSAVVALSDMTVGNGCDAILPAVLTD